MPLLSGASERYGRGRHALRARQRQTLMLAAAAALLVSVVRAAGPASSARAATCPVTAAPTLAWPNQTAETATDPAIVARLPVGHLPGTLIVDGAGLLGRVFVVASGTRPVTACERGRPGGGR